VITYLFDASAAVQIYAPESDYARESINTFVKQRDRKDKKNAARFFIPNICIPEVFNTLAKKYHNDKNSSLHQNEDLYRKCLKDFRNDIHWGKKIYSYDLNRYHIVAADIFITIEHKLPYAIKNHEGKIVERALSSIDILVITMACELGWIGDYENTHLITGDIRMKTICDNLHLQTFKDEIKKWKGPFDFELDRWIPPKCTYLHRHK
jgi:hypothetical protein